MKSKLTGISTILILILGVATPAWAGCPDGSGIGGTDYSGATCHGVCTDCDDATDEYVCCSGTIYKDRIILAEDGSGDPFAYGVLDIAGEVATVTFCCDGDPGEMDIDAGSAVYVYVDTYADDDVVCLQDSNASSCENNWGGVQIWPAGGNIDTGEGSDTIATCPNGTYADYVDSGDANDIVDTYDGDDEIWAGAHDDTVRGGDGADTIHGEGGPDSALYGGSGADTIFGEDGVDVIRGEGDVDTIRGGDDGDEIYGGAAGDYLAGDDHADYIVGEGEVDCLCAGLPGTGLCADGDADTLVGGAGNDDCYYNEVADGDSATLCGGTVDNSAYTCTCFP